jgi:hypothetical protein
MVSELSGAFFFLSFLAVLELELRTSCLLGTLPLESLPPPDLCVCVCVCVLGIFKIVSHELVAWAGFKP